MAAVADLTALQRRRVAAVVAAVVADAAVQPLHWIYDENKMKELTKGVTELEFREPSANPFYRIPTGSNSCYGDQVLCMLRSLVKNKGLSPASLKQETYEFFGPKSAYDSEETDKYKVGKEDKINLKKTLPISGPWRHGCIKEFLANYQAGKENAGSETDDQIDGCVRAVPLVALYAGRPDMLDKVEAGLRILQESDLAIACALTAARVMEQYILSDTPVDRVAVLEATAKALAEPQRPCPQDLDRAVAGQLRAVIKEASTPHHSAVTGSFRKN